ncbi:short-chain dehydrogenase [Nocardioides baekrokdamisoli]|uniref:Short-chain dehydrogenase n=1 Tax=Nocardioides baekrokdamisoli TaxID=1804624 RepID=A0A3G9IGT8_9ACTN|nr:SDR family oxidoreductase [Nocardioides baekrokdamisoli]BBH17556.1 short-chain dehydrogenase [Nocardioides baekrokdamisoli]
MTDELEGTVALITGASRGIGEGAAFALARRGAAVVVHGLDLAEAEGIAARIRDEGGRAIAVAGPIDAAATSTEAVAAAIEHFGRLDVLVTSAGIQRYGDAVETTEQVWNEVLDVNLKGVFLAAKAALPEIRKSPVGSVVIVASVQGFASQANVVAYTASKGALHAMGRAMAVDEAAYGVRVNTVSPGSVDTPMLRHAAAEWSDGTPEGVESTIADWGLAHALGRVATINEVGEVIAFLAGSRSSFVTGTDVRVDGGMLARIAAALPEKNRS